MLLLGSGWGAGRPEGVDSGHITLHGVDATGRIAPESMQRTFAEVENYAGLVRSLGAERLRFVATSASRDADTERVVRPYTLAQRFGHWYLYGHDSARGKALAFRIDRIRECVPTDERFEPPSEAELARMRLFSEEQGAPVEVRLGARAAAWALARPGIRLVRREEHVLLPFPAAARIAAAGSIEWDLDDEP